MKLRIDDPSMFDANKLDVSNKGTITEFGLRFYRGRTHTFGPSVVITNKAGEVTDRAVIQISERGNIKLIKLSEEVTPIADKVEAE